MDLEFDLNIFCLKKRKLLKILLIQLELDDLENRIVNPKRTNEKTHKKFQL